MDYLKKYSEIKTQRKYCELHEEILVTKEFMRVTGPRCIYGHVTLEFIPAESLRFKSEAEWPTSDNYDNAVLEAIFDVFLSSKARPLLAVQVSLKSIEWHELILATWGIIWQQNKLQNR